MAQAVDKDTKWRVLFLLVFSAISLSVMRVDAQKKVKSEERPEIRAKEAFTKGKEAYLRNEFETAATNFGFALSIDSGLYEALILKGLSLIELAKYKEALETYTKALKLERDFRAYFGLGRANQMLGLLDEAKMNYDSAIGINGTDYAAYYRRAEVNAKRKDYDEALKDLSNCIRLNALDPSAYAKRGQIQAQLMRSHEAVRDLNESIKYGGAGIAVFYYRGLAYSNLGEENPSYLDSAIHDLKKFIDATHDPGGYGILGSCHFQLGDTTLGRRYFRESISLKRDPAVYKLWGQNEFNLGYFNEARMLLESAEELYTSPNGGLFHSLGVTNLALCNREKAYEYFARALVADSLSKDVYISRIGSRIHLDDKENLELVLSDIQKLYAMEADNVRKNGLLTAMAYFQIVKGDRSLALETINRLMKTGFQSEVSIMVRSFAYPRNLLGIRKSISDLDSTIQRNHLSWRPLFLRAYFLREVGNHTKSCRDYTRAIELGAKVSSELKAHFCEMKRRKPDERMVLREVLLTEVVRLATGDSKTIQCAQYLLKN